MDTNRRKSDFAQLSFYFNLFHFCRCEHILNLRTRFDVFYLYRRNVCYSDRVGGWRSEVFVYTRHWNDSASINAELYCSGSSIYLNVQFILEELHRQHHQYEGRSLVNKNQRVKLKNFLTVYLGVYQ